MCNCCSGSSYPQNKVAPDVEDGSIRTAQYSRVNGWSFPLHPLQFVGWSFILLFAVTHFAILVHYLPTEWAPAGTIIPASGYIIHFVYHFLALTLDPADPAVRKKGFFLRHIFDRKKHAHVIENSYCYICQTQVSSRSKHCSACNKCVSGFDHHCKWLNNCVGERNYKLFLGCCISALLTALVMFIIDFYLMIVYYTAREGVLGRSSMNDWKLFVSTCKEAYIIFVIVNGLLLLIAMLLIGHLLIFHFYLICKNLSTYDYIMQNRASKASLQFDVESAGEPAPPPMEQLSSSHSMYKDDLKEKSSYEMEKFTENTTYVSAIPKNEVQEPVPVVEQLISTENVTNVYEVPQGEQSVDGVKPPSSRKKKRKKRSSSKVDLIRDEDEEGSLSSARSQTSLPSEDEERYNAVRNEQVLRNFQSPTSGRESKSRPIQLTEETAYANVQEVTRIESVVSRPRSPSPKQSQRISFANQQNDYVMRVTDKRASNSSLSTIALQDHDDLGKPLSPARNPAAVKPALSPTREESFDSKESSKNSILSTRRVEMLSKSDIPEEAGGLEEHKVAASPTLSLSRMNEHALRSPKASEVSRISLSQGRLQSPRLSVSSQLTNITLASEKLPTLASETELTGPVPPPLQAQAVEKENDMVLANAFSDSATLVFEDEFVANDNDQNIDFLQQSIKASEERQRSPSKSPPFAISDEHKKSLALEPGQLSDADSQKIASYVEAFKRKRDSDQFSFGSDSEKSDSGVPLATLNEDADTYALTDTLKRVKKLSDAFPTANDQDKYKKRSLPHPQFNTHESMSELSVVEYNRKKKLKKKRPGSSNVSASSSNQLPPLRGRKPLPGVEEENAGSDSDA